MNATNYVYVQPTVNFRNAFAFPMLLATLWNTVAVADTNQPISSNGFSLTLRYGKETTLPHESVQILYQKAVELLESSNFNSRAPLWDWKPSDILEGYRKTVSGKYLLVTFNLPRKIKTVGGEVSVKEIVIGLNGREYVSSLYTIDDEQRIVGHAKYSGPLCIEFLKLVKKLSDDT